MFLTILEIEGVRTRKKRLIEFECDQCKKKFTRSYVKNHVNNNRLTFCCNKCRTNAWKKDGILEKQAKENFKSKNGVEYPFQLEENKNKSRKTFLKKYGVEYSSQSKEIQEKYQQTCLKRYGVKNPTQSKIIRDKINETCLERYGTKSPIQSEIVKNKIKKTCLDKYGVKNPWQSEEIRKKCKSTFFDRYGVEYTLQSKELRKNCLSSESKQKSHDTMKYNGTYGKSKIEDKFYVFLCKKFGENNVERQKRINNWNIDFYIESIDTYIQFDGTYWHGLDRSINIIKESKNKRDKVIYRTYLKDREQNEWFLKHKISLVRVTDKEFLKLKL